MTAKSEPKWPADEVKRVPVADLIPYARNARTHSASQVDQIVASIREWGWAVPVLVGETLNIIAGHGRILGAKKLGMPNVQVMVAKGWSEAQKRAYIRIFFSREFYAGDDFLHSSRPFCISDVEIEKRLRCRGLIARGTLNRGAIPTSPKCIKSSPRRSDQGADCGGVSGIHDGTEVAGRSGRKVGDRRARAGGAQRTYLLRPSERPVGDERQRGYGDGFLHSERHFSLSDPKSWKTPVPQCFLFLDAAIFSHFLNARKCRNPSPESKLPCLPNDRKRKKLLRHRDFCWVQPLDSARRVMGRNAQNRPQIGARRCSKIRILHEISVHFVMCIPTTIFGGVSR